MVKFLPAGPSLEFLKKEAKKLFAAHKRGDKSVCATLKAHHRFKDVPDAEILGAKLTLQEAQHALALGYGFKSWKELAEYVKLKEAEMNRKKSKKGVKSFEDLLSLEDARIQSLLADTKVEDLAVVLLGESEAVRERLLSNMSERARRTMEWVTGTLQNKGEVPAKVSKADKRKFLAVADKISRKPLAALAENITTLPFTTSADLLELDDRGIQLVLTETDTNDLAAAMLDIDASVEVLVLKNMSKRAVALLKDIMEAGKSTLSLASREKAQKRMLSIANALAERGMIAKGTKTVKPSLTQKEAETPGLGDSLKERPLSQRDTAEMIKAFHMMADTARCEGVLSLENVIDEHVDDELTKLGLQLIVDGTDPNYVREITTTRKKALLATLEKRLDIIITAVLSIQSGDNPRILEEKCKAFL